MAVGSALAPDVAALVASLDETMAPPDDAGRCRAVKRVLIDVIAGGHLHLNGAWLEPVRDRYARRLLHRDPAGRYTLLAMVWDRGQGTPLHDHAGIWCVECVYRGRIRVTSYSVHGGDPERDLVRFQQESVVVAGVGEAGALIPPFEYHELANPFDEVAVTLHVYGGEMTFCHAYLPAEGGYRRVFRPLSYT